MQQHGSKYFAHSDPVGGVNIQLLQNLVMLHIKLRRITIAATRQQIFFLQTPIHPLDPEVGQKVEIYIFQNMVILHIKLKGMDHRAVCKHIFSP